MLTFACLALASLIRAAEIGCVFPAGGAPGTTIDVSVRGAGLRTANAALFSGSGIEAALTAVIPGSPRQPPLRSGLTDPDEVRLRVTIAPTARPGPRDFRLVCSNAFTAPVTFQVGRCPELLEREPDNERSQAMALPSLPVCINGRITETDTDVFRFKATLGQTLVAHVQARALRLCPADAGSGLFQPQVTLFDSQGHALATANGFRFDTDPLLVFKVPSTGDYALQLRDAHARGRDDFIYRLTFGEFPLVTGFFPMGARKGDNVNVALEGVNLPPQKVRIFSGNKTPESCLRILIDDKLAFPSLRFDLDTLLEHTESEANAEGLTVQAVPFPVIMNGTLSMPGEMDRFRFEGKAGQRVAVETRAQQLGSPLDTVIQLTDSHGTLLAENDNPPRVFTDLPSGFCDSSFLARLPADGTYEVRIGDARSQGGNDYHYRLRISEPRPGFELWVTPSTLSIPIGGTAQANVYVRRIDGFEGPIALQLDNPPLGIDCRNGHMASNAVENVITLSALASPKRLPHAPFELTLCGTATNGATLLRKTATPAHRDLSATDYHTLVPDGTWMANIGDPALNSVYKIITPESATCIKGSAQKPFTVTVSSGRAKAIAKFLAVQVAEPENGFLVTGVQDGERPGDIVVSLSCAKGEQAPPKTGNLVLSVVRKLPPGKRAKRPAPAAILTSPAPYVIE